MLVFEATDELQGHRHDDYHHAVTGELVYLPIQDCTSNRCGCTRGFAGFESHRATTTARVVDRTDLTIERLTALLGASLAEGGWIEDIVRGNELVGLLADEIVQLANWYAQFGIGTVVERDGANLQRRLVRCA